MTSSSRRMGGSLREVNDGPVETGGSRASAVTALSMSRATYPEDAGSVPVRSQNAPQKRAHSAVVSGPSPIGDQP